MRGISRCVVFAVTVAACLLTQIDKAVAQNSDASALSKPWYNSLKLIPVGPGNLDIGVNLRARYEYADNFNIRAYGTETSDDLLLLRTLLTLHYQTKNHGRAYLEMQDARYWLSDLERSLWKQNHPYHDELDIRQAFYEWQGIAGSPLGFKLGRQSISYSDRRVFGPGNWGNVGRYWWDAAKLYVHTEPVNLDLLYGRRVISEPTSFNDDHFPFHMAGAYAQFRRLKWDLLTLKYDLFYVLRYDDSGKITGESGTGSQETHSAGLHIKGSYGSAWDYSGTAIQQLGTYGRDDIRAYYLHAGAGYTFDIPWKPRIGTEYVYASGDSNTNDARRATYDGVFSDVALYYGRMNLFTCSNLESYIFSLSLVPRKGMKVTTDYHVFRLANSTDAWYATSGRPVRRDPTGQAGNNLGQELDVIAEWSIDRNWQFSLGWARFFPGSFMKRTEGNADTADWFFSQATYQF